TGAEACVADVGGNDFQLPRRHDERLRRRHFKRQWITQVVVREGIGDENRYRIRLLAGRTAGAPDPKCEVASLLLTAQKVFKDCFLQQIELRAVAEKTGFVDGQIFEEQSQLGFAFTAGEETVVAVKRVELASFEAALQAVLKKV